MLKHKCYVYAKETQVPTHLHLGQELLNKMIENRDSRALINADSGETLTYGDLAQMTVDVALSLTYIGVKKGDIISICSEKRFDMLATVLGIFCAGATFSPSDITYGPGPLLHRLKISKPKLMFCSQAGYDTHKETFHAAGCLDKYIVYGDEPRPGTTLFKDFLTEHAAVEDFLAIPVDGWKDIIMILFSSGTTGLPKGVQHTHLGLNINSINFMSEDLGGKLLLSTREWYSTYGLLFALAVIRVGGTLVYSARNGHVDCLAAIEKYRTQYLQIAPATVVEYIKSSELENYDVSAVDGMISASTPLAAEQVRAVKARFPNLRNVFQLYGLSEAGSVCNEMRAPYGPKDGSVGTPCFGFVMKVVDLVTRQPLGPNERGEICFKSPSVTPGYISVSNDGFFDEEGFYKSGDVGYYDKDCYFYVLDRIKELIKYKDTSIAPAELESVLMTHPSVREAGVVGAPDTECGEAPTAFVVLLPGTTATEKELIEFLEVRVTFRMKLAGGVRFVDKLPRGTQDKLDRKMLRTML